MRLICITLLFAFAGSTRAAEPEPARQFQKKIRPTLVKYCGKCHDPAARKNNAPFLADKTVDDFAARRGLWSSVAEQLRNRTMPPADEDQPSEADRLEIAEWVARTLRETACTGGEYAGTVTTRRLNRREYDNTIRDLLGVDLDASDKFPVDGSGGEGFDNNGETLFLPPILMERYLEAADEALEAVIVSPALKRTFTPADFLPEQNSKQEDARRIAPKSQLTILPTIYNTGKYRLRFIVAPQDKQPARLVLRLDGIAADRFELTDPKLPEVRLDSTVHLTRGQHAIALRCPAGSTANLKRIELEELRDKPSQDKIARHKKLFGHPPGQTPDNPRAAAGKILDRFLRRAFRRPVRTGERDHFLKLYDRGAQRGDPYEECIQLALKGVLVSPSFLFRIEDDAPSTTPQPINDHELAVRLSYFLWSTMPDDELFRLADAGKLHEDKVLVEQVDRMLDDPKMEAFAFEFVGQWLGTKEVGALVAPDTGVFSGEFTTELLFDLQEEPVYFFQHLIAGDRSLLELIDSDYVIVNRRLRTHYGLDKNAKPIRNPSNPWVGNPKRGSGGPFEEIARPDDKRGGVLGMGGVHMVTSYSTRTSPVLRGGWILETLLGVRVPSPPPDVPEFKRSRKSKRSTREMLQDHRANPSCAACHNLMDPLGFALDNFDVLGRWRDKEGPAEIDASASLPSGETFTGPAGLRKVLLERKDEFIRHLTAKMLGYAIGRSLTDRDDCTINTIADKTRESNYKVRTLIRQTTLSTPFRFHQKPDNVVQSKPTE